MADRESISKKTRFEVFKRDSFKCQYCGKCAPDVILEVDHINPIANGGKGEMLNLITSCFDCNRGKSDRLLSDNSVLTVQRKQIEELQERRAQLDMMLEWKLSLVEDASNDHIKVSEYWEKKTEFGLSDKGVEDIRLLVKKYGAIHIITSIDESISKYLNPVKNKDNIEFVFGKIKTIAKFNTLSPEKKEISERVSRVLRMAKGKFHTYDYQEATKAISRFMNATDDNVVQLEEILQDANSLSQWINGMYYAK